MELRNELAFQANRLSNATGAPALDRGAIRSAVARIDGVIQRTIGKDAAADFVKDKRAYGNFQSVLGATESAFTKRQGLFDPSDILAAEKRYSGRAAAKGETAFSDVMQTAQREYGDIAEQVSTGAQQAKDRARSALNKSIDAAVAQKKQGNRVLRNAGRNAKNAPQVAAKAAELKEARAMKKLLQERSIAKSKGTVEALAATTLLGVPTGWAGGPLGMLGTGALTAKFLSKPSIQRYMVGQTFKGKALTKGDLINLSPEEFMELFDRLEQSARTAIIQDISTDRE